MKLLKHNKFQEIGKIDFQLFPKVAEWAELIWNDPHMHMSALLNQQREEKILITS